MGGGDAAEAAVARRPGKWPQEVLISAPLLDFGLLRRGLVWSS